MKKQTIYAGVILLGLVLVSLAYAEAPEGTARATFAVQ